MNKIIITICALCLSFMASAQVNYTIKGTANGVDGEKVYIYNIDGDKRDLMDSTTVINNHFTFKGTQPETCFATISLSQGRTRAVDVFLENGIINVSLNKPMKATGTPTNDIVTACKGKINAFDDEFDILIKQVNELREDQKDEKTVLIKKYEEVCNKRTAIIEECINQNLNSIIGAYFLYRYAGSMSHEEISKILTDASPAMKENGFAKRFIELQKAWKRTEIGQKFTDFKMKDPNDKEIALSDYVGKGKYVLIDFWASWCGPCRREMPNVKAAYENFKSKGFEIVGVSLDNRKEDWLKGIKDLKITWPQMSDLKRGQCEGAKLYGVDVIPSTLLIDPNGIIIAKNLRGEAIEKKLSELLN